jgi:hypothetical protein
MKRKKLMTLLRAEDSKAPVDMAEDFEEEIGLANSFLPSAMGFSCFTKIPKDGFAIKVNVGVYEMKEYSVHQRR